MPSGYPIPDPSKPEQTKDKWGNYTRPGDVRNAKFHDFIGFFLFMLLFAALIAIFIVGLVKGRPSLIIKSWDETGNFCGYNNAQHSTKDIANWTNSFRLMDFEQQPYLFFEFAAKDSLKNKGRQICVHECPGKNESGAELLLAAFLDNCTDSQRICPAYLTPDETAAQKKTGGECRCPYPTFDLLNRCVPKVPDDVEAVFANLTDAALPLLKDLKDTVLNISGVSQRVNAVIDLAPTIAIFSAISIGVSFIWVMLLRCMAPVIVYLVAMLAPALFVGLGVWIWLYGRDSFLFQGEDGSDNSHKIVAGVCWGIAAILLLILIFLWGKLKAAVAVIKISARAIGANFTALFAPVISFLLLVAFWALLLVSSLWNYSAANFALNWNEHRENVMLDFDVDRTLQYLLIFNLVYTIFISVHIYFTNYYAQSAAIVDWYFTPSAQKGGCCNWRCLRGFALALFKGLGTIATSALIMTPVYIAIVICEYLDAKAKQDPSTIGAPMRFLIKCMKCCLYCFEKFLRYLNKCLLTFAQVYNAHWCRAVKLTIELFMSDIVMTLLMNGITIFIIMLSKLVVAALTTLGFIAYVKYVNETDISWAIPAFFVFFLSFVASSFVLGMFTNVIDIIFVCYLSDKDLTSNAGVPMYIDQETSALVDDLKEQGKSAQVEPASDDGSSKPSA